MKIYSIFMKKSMDSRKLEQRVSGFSFISGLDDGGDPAYGPEGSGNAHAFR
jgi:hypothetical protein